MCVAIEHYCFTAAAVARNIDQIDERFWCMYGIGHALSSCTSSLAHVQSKATNLANVRRLS